jgi:hypothetical protein
MQEATVSISHNAGPGLPFSFQQWEGMLEKMHESNPFLAGGLQEARCLSGGPGVLMLEFSQELQRTLIAKEEKQRQLEQFLREQGFQLSVQTCLASQAASAAQGGFSGSVRARKQERAEQRDKEIRSLALEHPLVRQLMERVPGATIIRIRPIDARPDSEHMS